MSQVNARSSPLGERDVLALAENVDEIYATKGREVVHLDLKLQRPDREAIVSLLLGPTGKLRAPTLRIGRTLVVGFDPRTYAKLLR